MSYYPSATVKYDVQVSLGGAGLVGVAVFGGGRSVQDLLVGRGPVEIGLPAPPREKPWIELEPPPVSGLLGGAGMFGELVGVFDDEESFDFK